MLLQFFVKLILNEFLLLRLINGVQLHFNLFGLILIYLSLQGFHLQYLFANKVNLPQNYTVPSAIHSVLAHSGPRFKPESVIFTLFQWLLRFPKPSFSIILMTLIWLIFTGLLTSLPLLSSLFWLRFALLFSTLFVLILNLIILSFLTQNFPLKA